MKTYTMKQIRDAYEDGNMSEIEAEYNIVKFVKLSDVEQLQKELKMNNKTTLLNKLNLTKEQYAMLCIFIDDRFNNFKGK